MFLTPEAKAAVLHTMQCLIDDLAEKDRRDTKRRRQTAMKDITTRLLETQNAFTNNN